MSDWSDAGLPAPLVAGFGCTTDLGLSRTPFATALAEQAQIRTRARQRLSLSFMLNAAQLATAEAMLQAEGYRSLTLPLVNLNDPAAACLVDTPIRLTADYQVSAVSPGVFRLACEAETLLAPSVAPSGNPFIFTLAMPADDLTFSLGFVTNEQPMSITLDWGDGTVVDVVDWEMEKLSHTYAVAGTYDVSISGECPAPYFYDEQRLIDIKQWGYLEGATQWRASFGYCLGLTEISATDAFGKNVVNCEWMFGSCENLTGGNFNNLDMSSVTNMAGMFYYTKFNSAIHNWDVSNVTNMNYMFAGNAVFNQSLDEWNVISLSDAAHMFYGCSSFNQPLNGWGSSTSNITDMTGMFGGCSSFNQPLDLWDVSAVTSMSWMFNQASSFNQPLDLWDVSAVTSMYGMFSQASSFNQNINGWNTSSLENIEYIFFAAESFNQPLDLWDVSAVTSMSGMFNQASSFNQPLDLWDVSAVTSMYGMFSQASSFNQNINAWDTSSLENIGYIFYLAESFNQPLYDWDVTNIPRAYMQYAFYGATAFNHDISCWDVEHIASLPSNFATNCPINGTSKMPRWGQMPNTGCANRACGLLLPMFGDNNGNVFADYSPAQIVPVVYGNTVTVTSSYKYYGSSGYFDGSGDYLRIENSSCFDLNASDFTIEAWVYPMTGTGIIQGILSRRNIYYDKHSFSFWIHANDRNLAFECNDNNYLFYNEAAIYNQWQHVAVCRQGTTIRMFLNGIKVGEQAINISITNYEQPVLVGRASLSLTNGFFKGYINDLRYTKGLALYTSDFTPPLALVTP